MKSKRKSTNINKRKTKKKITPGLIIEYDYNRNHDRFVMNYIVKEPKSGIIVLLPTVKLTDDLREKLYEYIHAHGHIKAIKKIKLDFDNVVKLVNQFYIHQHKKASILEIKRKVLLDVSWEQHKRKKIYVIVWKARGKTDLKIFEKKVNEFLTRYELNKVVDADLTDFMDMKKNIKVNSNKKRYSVSMNKSKSLEISDYYQMGGGSTKKPCDPDELEIVESNSYPIGVENKSEEEITLNFLTNILTEKLYVCSTHNYAETVRFGQILFHKNIIKNL